MIPTTIRLRKYRDQSVLTVRYLLGGWFTDMETKKLVNPPSRRESHRSDTKTLSMMAVVSSPLE